MAEQGDTIKKRKLSLDINLASKGVDIRPAVWTTPAAPMSLREAKEGFMLNPSTGTGNKKTKTKRKKNKKKEKQSDLSPTTPPVVEPDLPFSEKYLSWRYVMVLLFNASFVVVVFLRANMPVALVCMSKPPSSAATSSSNGSDVNVSGHVTAHDGLKNLTLTSSDVDLTSSPFEFSWDGQVQSLVLTSTILLSFAGPLLASWLQSCVSNKLLLTMGTASAALLTALCPTSARVSPYMLTAVRVVLGILFGFNVPVVGDSLAWWSPQGEKLTMVSLTFTGLNVGGVLTSFISGFLCSIPIDNGWPFIFYVFGFLAVVWTLAWHFLSSQRPEDHPFISEREKEYIIAHRANMEGSAGQQKKEKPPYGKILRSPPVWAFFIMGCCQFWLINILVSYLPMYFVDILGFPVSQAGVLISAVVLSRAVGGLAWTVIGNCLTTRFSNRCSRKSCLVIGSTMSGLAMVAISFFDRSNRWVSFALLLVSSLAQACGTSTLTAVPQDMAPRYAGLLTGMFVSFAGLFAVTGPPLVSLLTPTNTYAEWQIVWILFGTVNIMGAIVFGLLGNASIQPWAKVHRKSTPEIVSPFVTMGRRISTYLERPPITPVSPLPPAAGSDQDMSTSGRFDFTVKIEPATARPQVSNGTTRTPSSPGPDQHFPGASGELHLVNVVSGDGGYHKRDAQCRTRSPGLDNIAFEKGEGVGDDENSDENDGDSTEAEEDESDVTESVDRGIAPRKRAFSEFGLEVTKLPLQVQKDDTVIDVRAGRGNVQTKRDRKVAVVERPAQLLTPAQHSAETQQADSSLTETGGDNHHQQSRRQRSEVRATGNSGGEPNLARAPSNDGPEVISVRL